MSNTTYDDVDRMLETILNADGISDHNKDLIEEFAEGIEADSDVGLGRMYKLLYTMKGNLLEHVPEDLKLDEAGIKEMRRVRNRIERSDYSDWTKADRISILGKFYRVLYPVTFDRPDHIKRILQSGVLTKPSDIERDKDLHILTPSQVIDMVEAASRTRDKALILTLFETGARVGELLDTTIGDVTLHQQYAEITLPTFKNNKGPRTLTLTRSVGVLQRWLESHPCKAEDDTPLFVNVNRYVGESMSSNTVQDALQTAADTAGIDDADDLINHELRHSLATHHGRNWGLDKMMYWFGWNDPQTARKYMNNDSESIKNEVLADAGITDSNEDTQLFDLNTCPRCDYQVPPTAQYCPQCSLAVNEEAAEDLDELKTSIERVAEELGDGTSIKQLLQKVET